jgi:hypothetical protein
MGTPRGRMELAVLLCSWVLVSCARSAVATWQGADAVTWHQIQQLLETERQARPRNPWGAGVSMVMSDRRSERAVDGRGGIAVAPGRAMRMILVGAAGSTMLDAWVTRDQWRIAVPLAGIVRRGGLQEPDELPVGFLRWSFFRPLGGTLFGGSLRDGRVMFLLRDGEAVLEVRIGACDRGKLTAVTRRARGRAERMAECRESRNARPGDWVRYADEPRGMSVDITIESVTKDPPEEAAFSDPDAVEAHP